MNPTRIDWLSIFILGIVWGGTFMFVAMALDGYGPMTVAAARTTLGMFTLFAIVKLLGRDIPWGDRALWGPVIIIGVMSSALPFFLLSWGIQYVPSAFAGLSMAAIPLFVLPLAHFFSDEPLSSRKFIGVCLGFIGAIVLIGKGAFEGDTQTFARLACLAAALSYAISSINTRNCPPVDALVLSALALLVGSIVLVPAMLITEGIPTVQNPKATAAIILLGVVPTAAANYLRVLTIKSAGSVFLTLVNYQVPVWAMVFGAWVLSEALPLRFFVALALIMTGMVISQWRALTDMFRAS